MQTEKNYIGPKLLGAGALTMGLVWFGEEVEAGAGRRLGLGAQEGLGGPACEAEGRAARVAAARF